MPFSNRIHKGLLLSLCLAAAVSRSAAEPTTPSTPESTPPPDAKSQTANPDLAFAPGDTVEINHPYNPKTIGVIPPGWVPERIPNYTVRNPDVKLKNGTTVTVECPIYALVPDKASQYQPYREPTLSPKGATANQKKTLGSLLSQFIAENNVTGAQLDATLITIKNALDQTSDNPPSSSATSVTSGANTAQLLIDKPEPRPSPTPNPAPDITPKTDANASASPTPDDTPSRKNRDKDKDKDKDDDAPRKSRTPHKAAKPDVSPTPTPAKARKFLGIFPTNQRPEATDPTE